MNLLLKKLSPTVTNMIRMDHTHVIAGIDLAIATNDMTLRQRVDQLSTDRGALRLMGISDARQEQYVRDAALAALRR